MGDATFVDSRCQHNPRYQDPVAGNNDHKVRSKMPRPCLTILWVLAILIFGIGDLLTTSLALTVGALEINPIARFLIQFPGGNLWLLTIVKGVILSSLFLLSYLKLGSRAWTVPVVLVCAGTVGLIPNIATVATLL